MHNGAASDFQLSSTVQWSEFTTKVCDILEVHVNKAAKLELVYRFSSQPKATVLRHLKEKNFPDVLEEASALAIEQKRKRGPKTEKFCVYVEELKKDEPKGKKMDGKAKKVCSNLFPFAVYILTLV
jgi:hypothetical protein